ncbi:MAG TPA: LutB/LldF family L-lactate oxidation iron-sulfur protein [Acidimicrobiales bacterium]|jgi:L-lactate dehydrogenase complex protein LldF
MSFDTSLFNLSDHFEPATALGYARHQIVDTSLRSRMASALTDDRLRTNVARAVDRFTEHRSEALAELDDSDGLRHAARAVRQEVLADLPNLLERFADAATARGANLYWASTAVEARDYVARVVRSHDAERVVKSKSMVTEEIELTAALEARGTEVVETDLGEWIVQLAGETPSHIIAPALHRDRYQVQELFKERAGASSSLGNEPDELVRFARERLRDVFLNAQVGITGANLAVADTGSIVLVTNEGNGRLVTSLPPVHVVVLGMERLAANWHQADLLLALLARSATGQRLSSYTTILNGPRGLGETDGPRELHIVVLDNGRSRLLASEHHEMLGCIRCGACLNVCPVYRQVGGHAYGWVYPGPMGSVLTPLLGDAYPNAGELANASTLCGACMDACPVEIPLQDMLLAQRRHNTVDAGRGERTAWRLWAAAWSDSWRYNATTRAATWSRLATGLAGRLPVASAWASGRDIPKPASERFRDRWRKGLV